MMWRLGLLFTIVPLVETWLLIYVGGQIGPTATVLLLLLDGLLGAWLARSQGVGIVKEILADLQKGLPPGGRIVEAVMVLVGAVLLVTPGFFTDIVGYLFLFPPTRRLLAPYVMRWLLARFNIEGVNLGAPRPHAAAGAAAPEDERHFDHPVR